MVIVAESGRSVVLQDLIRRGGWTKILAQPATDSLAAGDKILTRVVKNKFGVQISAGTLVIPDQLCRHLSTKIDVQLKERGVEAPDIKALKEEMAEDMARDTISCWLNAYSGPGVPPPKFVGWDNN